ncbi:MAG: molybdopterin cofactor-binding domain-containing protein, partial [Gammaproteobacteria bacterium]
HAASGRALGFAALAAAAASRPLPDAATLTLKAPHAWRYIGQPLARNDIHDKITGRACYGIDVTLPGMKYAALRQAPVFGGRLRSFDADAVRGLPGVRAVVRIDAGPSGYTVPPTLWDIIDWQMDDAVAVVADSWWQAERALAALPIEWDEGPHAQVDSAGIARDLAAALDEDGALVRSEGDARAALAACAQTIEAEYHYPFLEHAPMEPMNCTARVDGRTVEAWAPTQYGDEALRIAAYAAGVALKDARFHLTLAGGGFGRRLHNDYVSQAVQIARQLPGTPVKLIVSREESMRRSYYPPPLAARLRAGLDANGELVAWHSHVVQGTAVEQPYGFSRLAYPVPNVEMRYGSITTPPGFAWMRGVGHTQMAWMNHGFMSEIAAALGRDTLDLQ